MYFKLKRMPQHRNGFKCLLSGKNLIVIATLVASSCNSNSTTNEPASGKSGDPSLNPKAAAIAAPPTECAIVGPTNVLILEEARFRALDIARGNGKLMFQPCVTNLAQGKMTLRAWAGKNDHNFEPSPEVLTIGRLSGLNLANAEFFLSSQKLYKKFVDDIGDLLDADTNPNQIVAFYPFQRSDKEIAYKIEVHATVSEVKANFLPAQPPPTELQTNPSPPASSLNTSFE
jgi:hypothetical protein